LGAVWWGLGKKTVSRPERAESGDGFLEKGQPAPPNQLEDSPSVVWGAAPAEIEFGAF